MPLYIQNTTLCFFMVLGSILINWFSRKREYKADAGGAHLSDKAKIISGLEALQAQVNKHYPAAEKESIAALKISRASKSGWSLLFASHPPIEMRIEALKELRM